MIIFSSIGVIYNKKIIHRGHILQKECLICGSDTQLLDVVDFNKSCEEQRGVFLGLSGFPVYYSICNQCSFTRCDTLNSWSEKEFIDFIYNDDYIKIDPDYVSSRPLSNAQLIQNLFASSQDQIRHLDYGGGNGVLSNHLREQGWNSESYDPFPANSVRLEEMGRFNLITAFEVFEHVPDPNTLMHQLNRLLDEEGLIVFSTLVSDQHLSPNHRINWWYCSPRNGHVSLFSSRSLMALAGKNAYHFGSFNESLHVMFKTLPDWAKKSIIA